jgi:hypothetical protein
MLDRSFPMFVGLMEAAAFWRIDPHNAHVIRLENEGLACEADTLGDALNELDITAPDIQWPENPPQPPEQHIALH